MRTLLAALGLALLCGLGAGQAKAADAEVRYVITNGGVDVGAKGQIHYDTAGRHDDSIAGAASGDPVRLPAGTYNVQVTFNDGDAHKEIWLDNQTFSGKVDRTVELAFPVAEVRYVITNGGVDTGDKGQVHYDTAGRHDDSIAGAASGNPVRLPAGTYNVQVTFNDGDVHREKWLDNQTFAGKVDRTVEIGVSLTDVQYVITNGGVDVGQKGQIHYFPAGRHDSTIDGTASGGSVRLPEGTYDIQVTFADGLARKEM